MRKLPATAKVKTMVIVFCLIWSFTTEAGGAIVPDVVGMTEPNAITAITGADLVLGTVSYACSDTVAADDVISQNPIGGTTVPSASSVDIVVSTGQPSVPDVTGMYVLDAMAAIDAVADISYGSSSAQCSDTIPFGDVISQSVTGTTSCGTVVDLVFAVQPTVPDVTGRDEATAIANINMVPDISVGTITYASSDTVPAGDVISQSIIGIAPCGTVVDLVVSSCCPALPADSFDDDKRCSAMWRQLTDDPDKVQVEETNQRLEIVANPDLGALASNIVGYWKMDDNDANTTVIDDSGNGNDGVAAQNTDVLSTTGRIDGALTFNGTSDYVDVGEVVGTGAYTKVAWIKRADAAALNNIISSSPKTHAFYAPSGQGFTLCAGHNTNFRMVQDPVPLDPDIWYHVAVTFDPNGGAGILTLYKDGAEVDQATNVPTQNPSTTTYIGRFDTGFYFNGDIDHAMVFNKTLTTEEIQQLYDKVKVYDLASSALGHWRMNDNAADTTVVDDTGNGNDGTAQQNTDVLSTTGKIDGALTFNGTSDYVDIGDVIGTGAYTKAAWIKRADAAAFNNIISSDPKTHAFFAPSGQGFTLCAGHNTNFRMVQDPVPLDPDAWYHAAVTFDPNGGAGILILYKDGVEVDQATNVPTQNPSTTNYIGRFDTGFYFNGSIDNAMVFNRPLTAEEIEDLYNEENGTELILGGSNYLAADYSSNIWSIDPNENFEVQIDYHYSDVSFYEGWVGIRLTDTDDGDYVSFSVGSDTDGAYFYVDSATVTDSNSRSSTDGTLYLSYDSALDELYLSSIGFGAGQAWQTVPGLFGGSGSAEVAIGGGSDRVKLLPGDAYLDNFEVVSGTVLDWPHIADLNGDGYIDVLDIGVLGEHWLEIGPGIVADMYSDDKVDLKDFAIFRLNW